MTFLGYLFFIVLFFVGNILIFRFLSSSTLQILESIKEKEDIDRVKLELKMRENELFHMQNIAENMLVVLDNSKATMDVLKTTIELQRETIELQKTFIFTLKQENEYKDKILSEIDQQTQKELPVVNKERYN